MAVAHTDRRPVRRVAAALAGLLCGALSSLIVSALAGCAMAPGMTFQSGAPSATANPAGAPQADSTRAAGPAIPPGMPRLDGMQSVSRDHLVEITDSLVNARRAAEDPGIPGDVRALFATPHAYTLGPGDVLNIVVWGHPELNLPTLQVTSGVDTSGSNSVVSGYTVDARGMVQYAFVGMLQVGGLTEAQARDLLTARLSEYVRNPQVTLRIQAYRSQRIYMDGAVQTPGLQIINDVPMTLPEAINRAGGFTPAADRSSVAVTRADRTVRVSLPDLIARGANPASILLRDGDLVRVYTATDSKVYVLGEVGKASTLTLNNGRLSLSQALGDAGGVSPYSGDAQQVYVVRRGKESQPEVFHLDASTPSAMALAEGFPLQANDVVFVDASALVRWSRVVNLLLPTAQSATASRALIP